MKVVLVQEDGKLPNLALMSIAQYHRNRGDEIELFIHKAPPTGYDRVYASRIFKFTEEIPLPAGTIRGGTGYSNNISVEDLFGPISGYDYTLYPESFSIGFTQRGCRFSCDFCVVPKKEGRPRSETTIAGIWRGEPHPRDIILLDNDFFGNPQWKDRIAELVAGKFRVCLCQGINVRTINDEQARALASLRYYDASFKRRSLYTAWDSLKDEAPFFRGANKLFTAGVRPAHVCVYMLIGYAQDETWEKILYRHTKITEAGMFAYPMVYSAIAGERNRVVLGRFQKWAVRRYYEVGSWPSFRKDMYRGDPGDVLDLL